MVSSIKVGDYIECLKCKEAFMLKRIRFDEQAEYIDCPYCKSSFDIQEYHKAGGAYLKKAKPVDEASIDVLKDIANILSKTELKESLTALKKYRDTCRDVGFSEKEVDNMTNNLAAILFFSHYHIDILGGKK